MLKKLSHALRWTFIVIGVAFVFQLFSTVYAWAAGVSLTDLVFIAAGNLQTDRDDRTNFLIVGNGGADHPGGELLDSIMLASYNHTLGTVTLLSFPRDLWLADDGGGMRINRVYEKELKKADGDSAAALAATADVIGDLVNLPIHYYAKVNFNGFRDLVDALGGITVDVPYAINDTEYPCADMIRFCPFAISAGLQHLDGATALKLARSRHTTSDFARAERQQLIIAALREQALSREVLGSPRQLKQIFDVLAENLETDLSFRDLVRLAKIGLTLDRANLKAFVISNDPQQPGGFLYTPPREQFGGASVVVPVQKDWSDVQNFARVIFEHPGIVGDKLTIEVLNASGRGGIAEDAAYFLNRYGLNAVRAGNYPGGEKMAQTTIFYAENDPARAALLTEARAVLAGFVPASDSPAPADIAARGYDLTLVLGADFELPDK